MVIHLLRTGVCLGSSVMLLSIKSKDHESFGFLLWLIILGGKLLVLILITLSRKGFECFEFKTALMLISNLNAPLHIDDFIKFARNNAYELDKDFVMTWALSFWEVLVRKAKQSVEVLHSLQRLLIASINTDQMKF